MWRSRLSCFRWLLQRPPVAEHLPAARTTTTQSHIGRAGSTNSHVFPYCINLYNKTWSISELRSSISLSPFLVLSQQRKIERHNYLRHYKAIALDFQIHFHCDSSAASAASPKATGTEKGLNGQTSPTIVPCILNHLDICDGEIRLPRLGFANNCQ